MTICTYRTLASAFRKANVGAYPVTLIDPMVTLPVTVANIADAVDWLARLYAARSATTVTLADASGATVGTFVKAPSGRETLTLLETTYQPRR